MSVAQCLDYVIHYLAYRNDVSDRAKADDHFVYAAIVTSRACNCFSDGQDQMVVRLKRLR